MLLFVITTTVLASANMFGQSYLITQGAPGTETRTVVWYIVDQGIAQQRCRPGRGDELRVALMLAVVSIANFRLFRYRED